ncbi:hypothetical protein [Novosphingobium sp. FSW06-99]|uniref:hypothetical protein n=1 Tax=Novosphingobium sp. FSW06-99 TaxID=1739113 RepID=UPI0012E3AF52|nr:hypothetical protein [Novosphingobium sp. FSW06-99]
MNNFKAILPALAIAASAIGFSPAVAADIVVNGHTTFSDIEYTNDAGDRVPAMRASLNAQIPVGTPISAARTIVRRMGAHCGEAASDGQTKCTYNSFESIEDHLHDVAWTVRLNSQQGKVFGLDVARESIGS